MNDINCISCDNKLKGLQTKFCSKTCKSRYHSKEGQKLRGIRRKLALIKKLGGKCSICGYANNLAALNFHHTSDKTFSLGIREISNHNITTIDTEIQKCVLLCGNCHMEHHYPH